MKLIDLHKKWCEKGELPFDGLCRCRHIGNRYIKLFIPDGSVSSSFFRDLYWGYGERSNDIDKIHSEYTPLRQTIVLFICAMKNEI